MAPASSQAVPWSPTAAIPRGEWVVRRRSGYPHNRLINPPQTGANAMNKLSNLEANLSHWAPHALALLRIVTVLLFVVHATMKFFDFPAPVPGVTGSLPPIMMVAGGIDIINGVMMLLGFKTRIAAFVASGEMAGAYFMAHAPQSFWPEIGRAQV